MQGHSGLLAIVQGHSGATQFVGYWSDKCVFGGGGATGHRTSEFGGY